MKKIGSATDGHEKSITRIQHATHLTHNLPTRGSEEQETRNFCHPLRLFCQCGKDLFYSHHPAIITGNCLISNRHMTHLVISLSLPLSFLLTCVSTSLFVWIDYYIILCLFKSFNCVFPLFYIVPLSLDPSIRSTLTHSLTHPHCISELRPSHIFSPLPLFLSFSYSSFCNHI